MRAGPAHEPDNSMTTRRLLRAAGLLMWAFAGIPSVIRVARCPACVSSGGLAIWVGAFVVFGVVFFRASRADAPEGRKASHLLLIQTLAALGMNLVLCTGFEAGLLVVVAVELGLLLPLAWALPWLALQSILIFVLAMHHMSWPGSAHWSIAMLGGQAFAFTIAAMAGREAAARRALEVTNAELEATRESLAQKSRDGERLRIARELHDLLGHDLIALHLELERARHLASREAKEPLERAHAVAKTLLSDLRKAVTNLRENEGSIDVAERLRSVVCNVSTPRIHLEAPSSFDLADVELANAVVRCAQEIVTNAIKHAAAENLFISLARTDGHIELSARDDGRGSLTLVPGNGLAGMRERLEKLGGKLTLETADREGFSVRATLPVAKEGRP
jgi:signal transduction histidine kinase